MRGGGGFQGEGEDEVSGRKRLAIQREATVQAKRVTWILAYFDASWVVHRGPRSEVPCSGRDAMEVRRYEGHMQASLGQSALPHHGQTKCHANRVNCGVDIWP